MKDFILSRSIKIIGGIISPGDVGLENTKSNVSGSDVTGILDTVYMIAGIVAVIMVIVGGILYISSAGDPGKVKTARDTVLYSVIGLIVVVLAFLITGMVAETLK